MLGQFGLQRLAGSLLPTDTGISEHIGSVINWRLEACMPISQDQNGHKFFISQEEDRLRSNFPEDCPTRPIAAGPSLLGGSRSSGRLTGPPERIGWLLHAAPIDAEPGSGRRWHRHLLWGIRFL